LALPFSVLTGSIGVLLLLIAFLIGCTSIAKADEYDDYYFAVGCTGCSTDHCNYPSGGSCIDLTPRNPNTCVITGSRICRCEIPKGLRIAQCNN
jgi:hypothetical protein